MLGFDVEKSLHHFFQSFSFFFTFCIFFLVRFFWKSFIILFLFFLFIFSSLARLINSKSLQNANYLFFVFLALAIDQLIPSLALFDFASWNAHTFACLRHILKALFAFISTPFAHFPQHTFVSLNLILRKTIRDSRIYMDILVVQKHEPLLVFSEVIIIHDQSLGRRSDAHAKLLEQDRLGVALFNGAGLFLGDFALAVKKVLFVSYSVA